MKFICDDDVVRKLYAVARCESVIEVMCIRPESSEFNSVLHYEVEFVVRRRKPISLLTRIRAFLADLKRQAKLSAGKNFAWL